MSLPSPCSPPPLSHHASSASSSSSSSTWSGLLDPLITPLEPAASAATAAVDAADMIDGQKRHVVVVVGDSACCQAIQKRMVEEEENTKGQDIMLEDELLGQRLEAALHLSSKIGTEHAPGGIINNNNGGNGDDHHAVPPTLTDMHATTTAHPLGAPSSFSLSTAPIPMGDYTSMHRTSLHHQNQDHHHHHQHQHPLDTPSYSASSTRSSCSLSTSNSGTTFTSPPLETATSYAASSSSSSVDIFGGFTFGTCPSTLPELASTPVAELGPFEYPIGLSGSPSCAGGILPSSSRSSFSQSGASTIGGGGGSRRGSMVRTLGGSGSGSGSGSSLIGGLMMGLASKSEFAPGSGLASAARRGSIPLSSMTDLNRPIRAMYRRKSSGEGEGGGVGSGGSGGGSGLRGATMMDPIETTNGGRRSSLIKRGLGSGTIIVDEEEDQAWTASPGSMDILTPLSPATSRSSFYSIPSNSGYYGGAAIPSSYRKSLEMRRGSLPTFSPPSSFHHPSFSTTASASATSQILPSHGPARRPTLEEKAEWKRLSGGGGGGGTAASTTAVSEYERPPMRHTISFKVSTKSSLSGSTASSSSSSSSSHCTHSLSSASSGSGSGSTSTIKTPDLGSSTASVPLVAPGYGLPLDADSPRRRSRAPIHFSMSGLRRTSAPIPPSLLARRAGERDKLLHSSVTGPASGGSPVLPATVEA
ncbi:hypothetical protein BD324DRAFT_653087 [Kockovaella imperatae]|uniref:Uncharacterized protein n=1 Tax=Kockovaella imperatae TaxID=4999 RepID=A0A1Y1U9W1_9TREE|nr:hypothetical protein BD324DRAFT_653087 [Kockovaella imperatae]ORX34831.1 hypothetical protein BD324DRAFT_653087 [Kockovaella imperatae]